MTERVPRRVARPVGPRDHAGNGTTCTCRERCRSSPATTSGSWQPGWPTAICESSRSRSRCGVRIWNGYAYFGLATDVPESEQAAMWERRTERARARIPLTEAYWRDEAVPELRAVYAWVAERPVETMPAAGLADTWDEAWRRIGRCWSIHFYAIRGPYQVLEDLADLYESVIAEAAPGEALALVGGGDPRTPRRRARTRGPGSPGGRHAGPRRGPGRAQRHRRRPGNGSRRRSIRACARRIPRRTRPSRPDRSTT